MPSTGRLLAYALVGLILGGFFLWVLLQMASANESLFRLAKIGIGMGLATIGGGLIYVLLAPTRRRHRN